MKPELTKDNVYMFAYTNIKELTPKKVKAIVMNIHGLGGGTEMENDVPGARLYTDRDFGFFFPYCGPWNWMNPNAVKLCDDIIDLFIKELDLPADIPVIPTGGSMGGLASLVFAMESRHNIAAVAVSCPVCDLALHYYEADDIPRTAYAAFGPFGDDLIETLHKHSPIDNIDKLPNVPYFFVHGIEDDNVRIATHSDKLVPMLKEKGYDVTYLRLPNKGHCQLTDEAAEEYKMFPFTVIK